MTPTDARRLIARLCRYAEAAERTAKHGKWDHRRQEAKGAARAYWLAATWIELLSQERRQG